MRDERRKDLKASLIDAAERMIAEEGLKSLRARDLATAAGCSVGQIYNVFADLDTLILEVNARTLALLEAALSRRRAGSVAGEGGAGPKIVALAAAYLSFADDHRRRWRALFEHGMAGGGALPAWYAAERARLFAAIEDPLAILLPHCPEAERRLLARTLFSATHGMVDLGLDEKLDALPMQVLRVQLETVVAAMLRGLVGDRFPD